MLYAGGFFSAADKRLMARVRDMGPEELSAESAQLISAFTDVRLPDMLFRYRARNFPQSLTSSERQLWQAFCCQRLTRSADLPGAGPDLASFDAVLSALQESTLDNEQRQLLEDLQHWRNEVCQVC